MSKRTDSHGQTVEDRLLALQEKKQEIADAALSGDKKLAANKLTAKDMLMLFKG